jgi:N-acetylmuramoyl-L-alanine amidase
MMIILLAAAFLLPRYGIWKQEARSTAGSAVAGQDTEGTKGQESETTGTAKGTIVIDAGHGGFDSGMVGESGISEKILNLVYARKLELLLQAAGYEVVQTRDSEDGLYDEDQSNKKAQDMQRRCAIIEEASPLLTVSIHQNSYPQDASVCGPQVFYYEQSSQGEALAKCIQDRLNTDLEIARPRMIKGNSTYYILKRSVGTTVIVECGFLTNPQEEAKLQEEAYQDALVQAVCDGILDYLHQSVLDAA